MGTGDKQSYEKPNEAAYSMRQHLRQGTKSGNTEPLYVEANPCRKSSYCCFSPIKKHFGLISVRNSKHKFYNGLINGHFSSQCIFLQPKDHHILCSGERASINSGCIGTHSPIILSSRSMAEMHLLDDFIQVTSSSACEPDTPKEWLCSYTLHCSSKR